MKISAETSESERHKRDIECILWHNGKLYSGDDDGIVKIWSKELKLVEEFKAEEGPVYQICSDEENNILYTSSDKSINTWKFANGKWALQETLEGHETGIRKLGFANGTLFSGDEGGEVKIWKQGKLIGTCSVHEEVWDMKINQNLIFTVRDKDVVINEYNESTGRCWTRKTIVGRSPLHIVQDKICFPDRTGLKINIHQISSPDFPAVGSLEGHPLIITAIGGADLLYSGGYDKKIIAWDLKQLVKLEEIEVPNAVSAIAYVESEKCLFLAGDAMIRLIMPS